MSARRLTAARLLVLCSAFWISAGNAYVLQSCVNWTGLAKASPADLWVPAAQDQPPHSAGDAGNLEFQTELH